MSLTRRQFLHAAGATGVGLTILGHADTLLAAPSSPADHFRRSVGYGDLVPDPAGLLDLPPGFSYRVVTRSGDPLTDLAGRVAPGQVPGAPDGTAAFAGRHGGTVLVNNHEQGGPSEFPAVASPDLTYDPKATGGTTTIHLDRDAHRLVEYVSLAGTWSNCAGGPTPWGTWLTCEETEQRADGTNATKDHGWVFEVDPHAPGNNVDPTPLTALGRFAHEAVAIDPRRGHAYLTEDAGGPNGLLYRFTPADRRHRYGAFRRGGALEAMWLPSLSDLSTETRIGASHHVVWKDVPDPLATTTSVRKQFDHVVAGLPVPGAGGPITRSRKLEGIYWQDGLAYVVASFARLSDGSAAEHDGQVWAYDPRRSTLELKVRYSVNTDPASDAPDGPDNITVTPSGGLVLAEDGEGASHVLGVNRRGQTFLIARNALNESEFTGPTFSADGRTLFVNIQRPGIVLAVTGPWRQGDGGV